MTPRTTQAGETLDRLKTLVVARLLLTLMAAGGAFLIPPLGAGVAGLVLGALAASAATNALVLFVPLRAGALRALSHALILLDTGIVTLLVYLTGWAGSPFLPLTFATVLGAAFLLGRVWALVYASGMVLALCAVTGFYHAAALANLPPPLLTSEVSGLWRHGLSHFVGHLLLETGALYAVGTLAGVLVERLAQERVLVREVLDLMGEGVVAVDARGRILVANAEARRCLRIGTVPVGQPLLPALPADVSGWLGPALAAEASLQMRQTVTPPVGPTLPLAIQVAPLSDGQGRRGTVVLVTDLSPERDAAAAERRSERLEATARLAMGIAHEIRNPLASIRGAAQEMVRMPDERLSTMILRESDRLDRILGEFLAYARLGSPRFVHCDLGRVLEETLELVQSRPEAATLEWTTSLPRELILEGDPEQLKQLFLNLVINALQALEEQGGKGAISVRAAWAPRRGTEGIQVVVSDSGPGIPLEARNRMFEPFFTTKPNGTGLGLALVARVASAHGGETRLSEEAPGACFEIWLPARQPEGRPHA